MKILVAGGNGFIGSHLLLRSKEHATIFSIDYTISPSEKDFFNIDLTDINQVNDFTENCDYFNILIFLVGLAHKKGKGQEFDEFRRINKQTLVNLLSALEVQGKLPNKIIFASTISVYGEKMNQNIYNEDSEKNPFSPYAVTKFEAEEYLLNNYNTQSWILRFAPVYAPNFLLNINRRTKASRWYYKVGNGEKKLSLCNLENIGLAVRGILEDTVPSGSYNISDVYDYSYNDLLTYVNATWIVHIPTFLVKGLYVVGEMMNNIFLKENATKLISDNVFPSDKIRQFIDLPSTISDIEFVND